MLGHLPLKGKANWRKASPWGEAVSRRLTDEGVIPQVSVKSHFVVSPEVLRLTNPPVQVIIKTKSEPRTRLLLQAGLFSTCDSREPRKQPSLGRVAAAFFALVHDDRDGIPSNVECNSHGPHLLSEM